MNVRQNFGAILLIACISVTALAETPGGNRADSDAAAASAPTTAGSRDLFYGGDFGSYYMQAGQAFLKNDIPAAIAAFQKALEIAPGHATLMFDLAQAYAAAGDTKNAVAMLNRVADKKLACDPTAVPVFDKMRDDPQFKAVAGRIALNDPPVNKSSVAFTVKEKDLIPEGIAWDPVSKTLFLSSIYKRKIVAIENDGRAWDFTTDGQDGLMQVLGMKVDAERRVLWVASYLTPRQGGSAAIHKYDLRTRKLIRKYEVDGKQRPHLFNDLAFTPAGDLYFTDSEAGAVWRIPHDNDELEVFIQPGTFLYPNGIALAADGKRLFVASWAAGISVVDLANRKVSQLPYSADTAPVEIDGLYLWKDSLIGVQNGTGSARVLRFYMNPAQDRILRQEVLESRNPLFEIPTTGTITDDGTFYYIANAQLRKLNGATIAPMDQLNEVKILKQALQ